MSSVIVLRNAAMALPGIAAVGVRVMMCSFVLVVALCVGLCLVDARSCCVRAIPNVVCNDRLRDISWRVCVFRASLCKRLFAVSPPAVVACALVMCDVLEC